MTEDGRSSGMVALCGLRLSLTWVWDHKDAQLDAITNSLGLGRSLALAVSHPKRDEAALRMGPRFSGWARLLGSCGARMRPRSQKRDLGHPLVKSRSIAALRMTTLVNFNFATFKENPYENLSGK